MAPGGLRESSRHASVISARFCDPKVPTTLEVFGTFELKVAPGRTPKITRKSTFCEKGAPRKVFFSIFAACTVFLDFAFDFGSILSEKSMFFRTRFPHGACVFFEMATLTIVWFLQYETYFFIFRLRAFFSKKMQKNDPKPQYEKSLEKRPSGDLFWSPKSIKIDVGAAGNRKNLRKMTKMRCRFSCKFLHAKKMQKNEKKTKRRSPRRNARCQREVRRVQNPPGFARPSA